ncbi:MAG: CotH kinase family protein [Bdellovibrionales bacterium]
MAKLIYIFLAALARFIYLPLRGMAKRLRRAYAYNNIAAFEKNRTQRSLAWGALLCLMVVLFSSAGLFILHRYNNELSAASFLNTRYDGLTIRHEQVRNTYGLPYSARSLLKEALLSLPRTLADTETTKININIDFKSYQLLKKQRAAALKDGVKSSDENTYVPASIDFQGKSIKAKLRLKGDLVDHWSDPKKWSFKIKTKKDTFMGMSVFAIQAPWTRNYQVEPLYFKTLRDLGILTPRYFFVEASVNGESIGIMAIEESFSKNLLESQERKEGPILKINEELRWKAVMAHRQEKDNGVIDPAGGKLAAFENPNTFVFEAMSSPDPAQTDLAISLMRAVLEHKMKPSEVLDVDIWGKYLANAIIWGAVHDTVWTNLRLYYNPISARIEPIAYDAGIMDIIDYGELIGSYYPQILDRLILSDPVILASVKKHIAGLAKKYNDPAYIDELKAKDRQELTALRKEFYLLPSFNYASLSYPAKERAQAVLQNAYFKTSEFQHEQPVPYSDGIELPTLAMAFVSKDNKRLELRNVIEDDIEITGITAVKNNVSVPYQELVDIKLPLKIEKTKPFETAKTFSWLLKNVTTQDKIAFTLQATTPQQAMVYEIKTILYPEAATHPVLISKSVAEIRKLYPAFRYDAKRKEMLLENVSQTIDDFLIFPKGVRLKTQNAKLAFGEEAGLFVQGAVQVKDSSFEPATKGKHWRGFIVMEANRLTPGVRSVLDGATFRATDFPKHGDWGITGGVTFNQSNLDIRNSRIIDPISEDGINIIRSHFTMDGMKLSGSHSDGFDGDFATGSVTNSSFSNTGGDGIDFSGSHIKVRKCVFDGIHDKAVSMGEDSHADVADITVTNSATGVAAKDLSSAIVKHSVFHEISHAVLMAYQKKPEYGGGRIEASDITFEPHDNDIVAQIGSSLILDGKTIPPIKVDIDALYKEGYMKK